MLEEIYLKRIQTHIWNDKIPSKKLINSLIKKTYDQIIYYLLYFLIEINDQLILELINITLSCSF